VENLTVDDVYGTALYEAAAESGKTDAFVKSVEAMREIFKAQPEFFLLLRMPSVTPQERKDLAARVFEGRIEPELLNLLYVLVDKRRIGQFDGIARAFIKEAAAKEGVSRGTVESAAELTKKQVKRLEEETGKLLRRNVRLEPEVNPQLIGGVRIYVDGKLIDASIRRKLDELKEQITR
jgi:ATP synthase F1 delta subunit